MRGEGLEGEFDLPQSHQGGVLGRRQPWSLAELGEEIVELGFETGFLGALQDLPAMTELYGPFGVT